MSGTFTLMGALPDANFSSINILSDLDLGKFVVVKQIHKLVVCPPSKVIACCNRIYVITFLYN